MCFRLLLLLQMSSAQLHDVTCSQIHTSSHINAFPLQSTGLGNCDFRQGSFSYFPNFSKNSLCINKLNKIFGTIWIPAVKYCAAQPCESLECLKCLKEDWNIPPQKVAFIVANLVHNEQLRHSFQLVSASMSWRIFHLLRQARGFFYFFNTF